MVAEKHAQLVPARSLVGAGCQLSELARLASDSPATWAKLGPTGDAMLMSLTPAERLVAIHVAQGLSNKEISSALGRAEPTIKHQVSAAIRKCGVQSRCQLIVMLLR